MGKECRDHLGNVYSSVKDMCKFWNISKEKYKYRKRHGWSLEDILTKSITSVVVKKECTDHLGNVYSSIKDMCAFYKISQDTFNFRLKAGWTLEEALTIPIYKYNSSYNKCYDHLGNEYKSTQEMCKKYNIDRNTYRNRIKRGWSIEEALTKPTSSLSASKIQDHLGNEYNSLTEMCKAYKIRINTFRSRIERGSSIKDALTMPVASSTSKIQDHLGNEYRSIKEMCKKYHIADSTYRDRINNGWSVEEALTINIIKKPKKEYITCCNNDHKSLNKSISKENHLIQDHLGNTYKSIKEMCRKYNIDYNVYDLRIKNGWDLEKALTTSTRKQIHRKHSQPVYDYLGKSYANEKAMCKYYNIPWKTFRMRCHYKKWPLEKALSEPVSSKNSHYNIQDHLGNSFNSVREMLNYYHNNITNVTYRNRLMRGWTKEEAITIPRDMYIGEYRVAECLKQLNVKFYHDCQIKVIFRDFNLSVNWDEFLNKLKEHLNSAGINWSKKKIEKLRPDFVLYTDENNKIRGVIEFDGEQHQNFFEFFTKTIEEFLYRSDSDFVKQTLWEYLNIPMLRIRHDQVDMIDEMVTDFVNQPEKYINNHNTYLSEEEYWSILTEQKAKIESAFAA